MNQKIVVVTDEEKQGNATLLSSGLSLLKYAVGAGILMTPLIAAEFGYIGCAILLLVTATASCFGLYLYTYGASVAGRKSSPYVLAEMTYPSLGILFELCIVSKNIGVALTYMILCGSISSEFASGFSGSTDSIWCSKRAWTCGFTILIIGPLSFLRKIDNLKHTSFLGSLAAVYLVGLSVYTYFTTSVENLPGTEFIVAYKRITIEKIGIFAVAVYAFTCHQSIFLFHNETKDNSVRSLLKMNVVVIYSAFTLYLTFIFFSYLTFADKMTDSSKSIFEHYPKDRFEYQLARILFAFLLSFSYPLQVLPFRVSVSNLIYRMTSTPKRDISNRMYISLTLFILCTNFVIAMFLPRIDLVLNLIGSLTSAPICYIFPSIFYLKLTEKNGMTKTRIAAIFLFLFGASVTIVCTGSSLYRIWLGMSGISK